MRLSESQIKAIPAPEKRISLSDGRGLELRMTPDGSCSWSLLYRYNGTKHRYTIGPYPAVRLKDARLLADKLRYQVANGQNPQKIKRDTQNANIMTVLWCYERFLKRYLQPQLRTWKEYDKRIKADVLPSLADKEIKKIQKSDIIKIIDSITDRDAPILANRVLQYTSKFFKWCVGRGYIDTNPAANIPKPSKEKSRERVLSVAETRLIYESALTLGAVYCAFVRLLILTGQRRSEISNLEWSEVYPDRIEIGSHRSKNGKPIITPLNREASTILKNLPRNNGLYVFSTTGGHKPIGNFSKTKNKLTHHSGVENWTYHDFRRTIATELERQGVSRHNLMYVLNHTDNTVTAIYDRSEHIQQKRTSLSLWAELLCR